MIRRKSDDISLFKSKQAIFFKLLSKNKNINENSIIKEKSENVNNLTNVSYSEESNSYFNNTLNMID